MNNDYEIYSFLAEYNNIDVLLQSKGWNASALIYLFMNVNDLLL
jgi:hypothetical protein